MADVLACIDRSAYANSVCDHAGWFASDPDIGVEVLHVVESPDGAPDASAYTAMGAASAADPLVDRAVERLREEGVGPLSSVRVSGAFVKVATGRGARVIVMGKRGETSEAERRRLGSHVDAMVRATSTPICLTSKRFLPIHRALVLLDVDMDHRTSVDFVLSQPRLSALPLDVVVAVARGEDPDPKVEWVRAVLGDQGGEVFGLQAEGLNHAVVQYMESRAADLVVVSRAVVAPDPEASLGLIEDRGLWGTRTPVLIC